ncbi:MAG: DUF6455 family protein [Pseudomonadota bacterium]
MHRPTKLGDPRHHLQKIRAMAKSAGVDLSEAQQTGALPQDGWAAAVTRCRGCPVVKDCETFLSLPEDAPRPIPDACPNAGMLRRLAEL